MLVISLIQGLAVGLEYFSDEEMGFGINLDLGIIRFTYYFDIETDDL